MKQSRRSGQSLLVVRKISSSVKLNKYQRLVKGVRCSNSNFNSESGWGFYALLSKRSPIQ